MEFKFPAPAVVFKAQLGIHLLSAVWNIIGDCDETYNYWEPLHFLIYKRGFQTWEYSPQYSLRSYAYLWLNGLPAYCINLLLNSGGALLFYFTRLFMAILCTCTECYLYSALYYRFLDKSFAFFTILFLSFSAGNFIASTAFLPSSFALYLSNLTLAFWAGRKFSLAIGCVACSAIVGWPFSAALGIPLAFDILILKKKVGLFAKSALFCGIVFAVPLILIDSYYFGKLVVAPFNILKYNVFNSHGSELYGVESFTFYLKNYLINFNISFLLSIIAPLILVLFKKYSGLGKTDMSNMMLYTMPYFVWNGIFLLQPHKEERFLFPVYPFLALSAAVAFSVIIKALRGIFPKRSPFQTVTSVFVFLTLAGFIILNVSRIVALVVGYSAPTNLYSYLTSLHTTPTSQPSVYNVCVGREWHRFPTSFLLHTHNSDRLDLHFIESDFRGQLPAKYDNRWGNATRLIHKHFNDANQEERSRYVTLDQCDYLIDRETPDHVTQFEPNYSLNTKWKTIKKWNFLDASKSSSLYRTFYIPQLFERKNTFVHYVLYKRIIEAV